MFAFDIEEHLQQVLRLVSSQIAQDLIWGQFYETKLSVCFLPALEETSLKHGDRFQLIFREIPPSGVFL